MPLVPGEGIGCALLSPAQSGAGKAAAGPPGSCTAGQELHRESGNERCCCQPRSCTLRSCFKPLQAPRRLRGAAGSSHRSIFLQPVVMASGKALCGSGATVLLAVWHLILWNTSMHPRDLCKSLEIPLP